MTDRDTFAAAALTGLIANGDYSVESTPLLAYRMADSMLRERGRTNHDAVPEAKADGQGRDSPATPDHVGAGNTQEPVAWAVRYRHADTGIVDLCITLEDCRYKWGNRPTDSWRYEPLYRHPQPALTDEEREAVLNAARAYELDRDEEECAKIATTLRKLLERLG